MLLFPYFLRSGGFMLRDETKFY